MSEKFLVANGIFSEGYGFIPKKLMRDKGLSVEAKAIYAYLSSFAGAGMSSYPSVNLMLKELGISKDRFYKHRKMLIDLGYVSIQQIKSKDSTFSNNVYVINTSPLPCFKDTEKPDTEKPDTEDKDTNSNSSNSNSINSNSTKEVEAKASSSSSDDPQSTTAEMSFADQCRIIIEKWNSVAPLPIKLITPDTNRAKQLKARIKTYSIDGVLEAIDLVSSSQFLQGDNKQNWVITFDWFVKPSNFQKVFEGNYTRERVVRNEISNRSNQRTETKMERARRVQREIIEQLERFPDQATGKDVVFHD